MSRSAEDALCKSRINRHRQYQENCEKMGDDVGVEFETECHYNHYGDRGVADLFVRETDYVGGVESDYIYEFKSDAAIESATGANEILRQFNRMVSYFYKDEDIDLPKSGSWTNAEVTFELCFNATPAAYEHVMENIEMYQTVSHPRISSSLRDVRSIVTFRSELRGPCTIASSTDTVFTRDEVTEVFEGLFVDVLAGAEVPAHE